MMKHPFALATAAMVIAFATVPAEAQRGDQQAQGKLVPLGEEIAKFNRETDSFAVGPQKGRFTHLVFAAERSDLRLIEVKVGLANGGSEVIAVNRSTSPDKRRIVVDLPGRARRLTTVEATYRTLPGAQRRAIVALSGRLFVPPPRFDSIARERVSLRRPEFTVPIGRQAGRFSAIRVTATGREIFIRDIVVIFGNGSEQTFPVNDWLAANSSTPPLRLEGRGRFIDQVLFKIRPRRGRRPAGIEVLGRRSGPQPAPKAELGRQPPIDRRGEPRGYDRVTRVRLSDRTEPNRIRIGRRAGAIRGLVLRAIDNGARIRSVTITYGNGQTDKVDIAARMQSGDVSRSIDFGRPRFVREVVVVGRSRRRGPDATLELYADLAGDIRQRPRPRAQSDERERKPEWKLLASHTAPMFRPKTQVIRVGRKAGPLRALRVTVKRHDVRILGLEVLYVDGSTQDLPISGTIADGTTSDRFKLKGRFIQDIKLRFQSSLNLKGEGLVEIWALR